MKNLLFLILLFSTSTCKSQVDVEDPEVSSLPKVTKIVNDFENILEPSQENILAEMLYEYDLKTTNQIVIVTVSSISPFENMFDFSLKLAQVTGAGTAEKDNGIMIVISKNLRQIQIQNGDGIVKLLTDEETKSIIEKFMISEFKKDNYFAGIKNGLLEIIKELH